MLRSLVISICLLLTATPALAELPAPVRAMIDAAISSEDPDTVRKVVALAKQTNPDDGDEIDALLSAYEVKLAEEAAATAAQKEENIRSAGLFENWSGKGELGAFRSTGNSSNTGLTASLALKRDGIDWRHKLTGRVDYQRTNGVTTREQYLARYEPEYRFSKKMFAYALAQYEKNRFQGFTARYALSSGIGYQIVDDKDFRLSAKAGPAYRVTEFLDGTSDSRIAALFSAEWDWDIAQNLKLTQAASAVADTGGSATIIVDSSNTTLNLLTGLNAQLSDRLTARLSYNVDYDSNPPAGTENTDTLSRMTLIYDF